MSNITGFLSTAIGSLPFADADEAIKVILDNIPRCPIWPQLPKRGLHEQMEIQYSEGLPCTVIEEDKTRLFFNTADEDACAVGMGTFYEKYMAAEESGDWSEFAISESFSAGIYGLEKALQGRPQLPCLKIQTTGPMSFGLSIVDENKRAIYYNEAFRDVIVKSVIAKSKWQIDKFKPYAKQLICFIDEPILSAFGSSTYVSVSRDDVVGILNEIVESLHASDTLVGVHCCGNTEWPILVDAGVDIINFDAFGFGETIALYPQKIKEHLEKGNYLAWGIVPTSNVIFEQDENKLASLYDEKAANLSSKGIDKQLIYDHTIITPSCGTGSLSPEAARRVFELLGKTGSLLGSRHGK